MTTRKMAVGAEIETGSPEIGSPDARRREALRILRAARMAIVKAEARIKENHGPGPADVDVKECIALLGHARPAIFRWWAAFDAEAGRHDGAAFWLRQAEEA